MICYRRFLKPSHHEAREAQFIMIYMVGGITFHEINEFQKTLERLDSNHQVNNIPMMKKKFFFIFSFSLF
jgi:hypothetical protein